MKPGMTRAAQRRSRWMPCAARSTAGTRSTRFGLFSPRRAGATSRLGPAARRCAPALGSGLRLEASARSTSRVLTRIPTAGTGHTRRRAQLCRHPRHPRPLRCRRLRRRLTEAQTHSDPQYPRRPRLYLPRMYTPRCSARTWTRSYTRRTCAAIADAGGRCARREPRSSSISSRLNRRG